MSTPNTQQNAQAGEAGQQGRDRQPQKAEVNPAVPRTPGPDEAATPAEVQSRSKNAISGKANPTAGPDLTHPGPDRLELEKSKGNLHHNQHEKEPDMQNKVQDL